MLTIPYSKNTSNKLLKFNPAKSSIKSGFLVRNCYTNTYTQVQLFNFDINPNQGNTVKQINEAGQHRKTWAIYNSHFRVTSTQGFCANLQTYYAINDLILPLFKHS